MPGTRQSPEELGKRWAPVAPPDGPALHRPASGILRPYDIRQVPAMPHPESPTPLVQLADIEAATLRLRDALPPTPFLPSATLSEIAGCELWLKFENLQFTASFKERGALNKLLTLPTPTSARGVIAMRAGNHAQGVAYHAARLGSRATIVMPRGTPNIKVARTRRLRRRGGAAGRHLPEAAAAVPALVESRGLTLVHPYDDPAVIAGQGTVALEMLQAGPALDCWWCRSAAAG